MPRLLGIARHARPHAPMERLDHAAVTLAGGIDGDFRGAVKPGGRGRRQVTLIAASGWADAMADLGVAIDWAERRANLLVEGLVLEGTTGRQVRVGDDVVLEITGECDPCSRMETIAPGLKAALLPHWRGGATARVIAGGAIVIGDEIRWETV
jgi:MOSC domain-containing protein YiiM